jgi:hypothetical protein
VTKYSFGDPILPYPASVADLNYFYLDSGPKILFSDAESLSIMTHIILKITGTLNCKRTVNVISTVQRKKVL